MTWEIIWSVKSSKQMKKIDKTVGKCIYDKLSSIRDDPFSSVVKLTGSPFYKIRVGNYRVILDLKQDKLIIFVVDTDHRKKVYD